MRSGLRNYALRSARRSPERATSQLMHKANPPGLAQLPLRFAPIFGKPKHYDAGGKALSDSRLVANQAYPRSPNHPLAIRHSPLTDPTGECPPRRSRR
jgi:hypothetical protein